MSLIFLILGLIIGSFLNCLVYRLRTKESMLGRSHCPKCGKQLSWFENIPVFSFLFLRGRCRHCEERIAWQYFIVEVVTGILFATAFYINFNSIDYSSSYFYFKMFRDLFFISVMIVVFIYDLKWYLILDSVTLPAAAVLLATNLFIGMNWLNLLISGIIGAGFFLLQFVISRGKWIGGGDIRLGLVMGVGLGWPLLPVAMMLAYISGALVGIGLILAGKKRFGSKLPFGVFLSAGSIVALFWGERIAEWYLGIL